MIMFSDVSRVAFWPSQFLSFFPTIQPTVHNLCVSLGNSKSQAIPSARSLPPLRFCQISGCWFNHCGQTDRFSKQYFISCYAVSLKVRSLKPQVVVMNLNVLKNAYVPFFLIPINTLCERIHWKLKHRLVFSYV